LASTALDTAAMATGRTQINDPLNIAALTLGATGLLLGGIGTLTPSKYMFYLEGYPRKAIHDIPVPRIEKTKRNSRRFPSSTAPDRAASEEIVIVRDDDTVRDMVRAGVAPEIHISSSMKPFYRRDHRHPIHVFEAGFLPWRPGAETSLLLYQASNKPSKFVGFTRSRTFADTWEKDAFTYEVIGAAGGISMNKTTRHPTFLYQQEYAFPYGIRREFIYKATSPEGREYYNPHFDPYALMKANAAVEPPFSVIN
ncbi:hypothetical protein, partial [Streptomyces sp. NPDC008121]|uniref:scabin-related ADP-ribosyltransferase n=1 Tax=Streptomyces sp. NPDC008121 TaxID=3364809 RepID=UPI0036EDBF65